MRNGAALDERLQPTLRLEEIPAERRRSLLTQQELPWRVRLLVSFIAPVSGLATPHM
jgi:hypothetical protein